MNQRMRAAAIGGAVVVAAGLVAVWLFEGAGSGSADVVPGSSRDAPGMVLPEGRETAALPPPPEVTPTTLKVAPAPTPETAKVEPAFLIRGRVLAPDDTPVEGAQLVLSKDEKDAPPIDTQISDAEGRFRIELPEAPEGSKRLAVSAEGFAFMTMNGESWSDEEFDVRMHWTATVSGVVRDAETGAPIAHALVSSGGTPVETGSDGSYSLGGVMVGWDSGVTAEHEDYARKTVTFLLKDPEPVDVDVELDRGVLLECTVVDRESGEPVQGAEIRRYIRGEAFAHVDGSGRFSMRLSPSDDHHSVMVVHPDYSPLDWSWSGAEMKPGLSPRLPLERPAWIELRLVDEDGELVHGSGVYASQEGFPSEPLSQETLTAFGVPGRASDGDPTDVLPPLDDVAGELRVPVIASDKDYTVSAWHPDYVSARSEPLELRLPGSRASVELVLLRGGTVSGRVLRNGEPLNFVEVRCDDAAGGYLGRAYTSSKGDFRIENLLPGEAALLVRGQMNDEVLYEATLTLEAGAETVHDVSLDGAVATLEGHVMWITGKPAADKSVRAWSVGGEKRKFVGSTQTDEAGAYVLEVPADGLFDVSVSHVTSVRHEGVASGAHDVDFVLPSSTMLTLDLRDSETGKPVQMDGSRYMNWLSWRPSGTERYQTRSVDIDIHGHAEVELPVGVVDLAIDLQREGYRPLRLIGVAWR